MKAIQLEGFDGLDSLRIVEKEKPRPGKNEVLIEVKAAGINFAELEMTRGRYPAPRPLPVVMGFEASGVVAELGAGVTDVEVGDRVTSLVLSGGYADYATAHAGSVIPIPEGMSFAEASAITIQGLSAYTLLKLAARPRPDDTVLIQAAAGGVGLFLVQLSKAMGVKQVIALASSGVKLELVTALGADVTINYTEPAWAAEALAATGGKGADVVLESTSGEIADETFKLIAPFGRIVLYGAQNAHDSLPNDKVQQLIHKNQSIIGFNFPSLRPEQIQASVPPLLDLIQRGSVKLFANHAFALADVKEAFRAISDRRTIGKVVLIP
jgi:NADPH2:quinone reductase